ncbi:MAG: DUF302 domain-containing protein, partial [Marinirhabdus sp.]
MKNILFAFVAISLVSCGDELGNGINFTAPSTVGLAYVPNDVKYIDIYSNLRQTLVDIPTIKIEAEVDHAKNAQSIGKELPGTGVLFFGNPTVGTPLMTANRLAGLDLPQRMLVYKNEEDVTFIAYNTQAYTGNRYGITGTPALSKAARVLDSIALSATGSIVLETQSGTIAENDGIKIVVSKNKFSLTYNKLREAIRTGPFNIIAAVNHSSNAASVGMDLQPTRVIIFGNPVLGTPLMQNERTIALDLPHKMLVYEDGDVVKIAYNDPYFLASRHNLEGNAEQISTIAET